MARTPSQKGLAAASGLSPYDTLVQLAADSDTSPTDTSQQALGARAKVKAQQELVQQKQEIQGMPADQRGQASYFLDFNNRDIGGLKDQWGPFFEGVAEAGQRRNMNSKLDVGSFGAPETPLGGLSDTVSPTYDPSVDPHAAQYLGAISAAKTMAAKKVGSF